LYPLGTHLSVLYIARVGLEPLELHHIGPGVEGAFSPLHSEGGIGTSQLTEHPIAGVVLSVLYIARVGLERTADSRRSALPTPAFSPLHSEGGIGTLSAQGEAGRDRIPFSPLHSEGGIGTGKGEYRC